MYQCTIDGCDRKRVGRGWCKRHYGFWQRNGDPLKTAKTPKGEPTKFYNDVVRPYDGDACLFWPYSRNTNGRGHIVSNGKLRLVSRMVCEELNGPPPTDEHEAAHSCGNGHLGCVAGPHLSWKTATENQADRLIHGTHSRGEKSPKATITEAQAREILSLKGIERPSVTASKYGVSLSVVSNLQSRSTWAWI